MKAYERLLNYVVVRTPSDENSETVPSSACQFDLASLLEAEMKELGLTDVILDDQCYLYGKLPATEGLEDKPAIGFIAHMDTVSDFCDHDIKPIVTENYDGGELRLGTSDTILSPKNFPHLADLKGRTLITSDGTTVLGADDKAGIAEVLTVVDEILKEGLPHGKICIGFTPDEEIARGAKHFDVEGFGADYGYTLDGSAEGEIQYENFNASTAFITIHGVSVHTGTAKDVLVNSQTIGTDFHQMLPVSERPETTEGYEGFYHLVSFHGNVTETKMKYFIRDFDTEGFHARAAKMQEIADSLNEKYGAGTVEIEIVESYYNMREKIEPCMQLIEYAKKAAENTDIVPDVAPIRGGTDGARLSFKGLPCPNLGTGGYAFHGVYEHITVEGMDKAVVMVKDIVGMFAK